MSKTMLSEKTKTTILFPCLIEMRKTNLNKLHEGKNVLFSCVCTIPHFYSVYIMQRSIGVVCISQQSFICSKRFFLVSLITNLHHIAMVRIN